MTLGCLRRCSGPGVRRICAVSSGARRGVQAAPVGKLSGEGDRVPGTQLQPRASAACELRSLQPAQGFWRGALPALLPDAGVLFVGLGSWQGQGGSQA